MEKNLINVHIYEDLINQVNQDKINESDKLVQNKKVNLTKVSYDNKDNFEIHGAIEENKSYIKVSEGEIENLSCTCEEYHKSYCACIHVVAIAKEFMSNSEYIKLFAGIDHNDFVVNKEKIVHNKDEYKVCNQLIKSFYNISIENDNKNKEIELKNIKPNISIDPKIIYSRLTDKLKLEVKIGEKQFYKVKSFPQFYDRFLNNETYKYGKSLEIIHNKEAFVQEDQRLLEYILEYAEIVKYANESANVNGYEYYTNKIGEDYITISNSGLDELFEIEKNRKIQMEDEYGVQNILFSTEKPNIKFKIQKINEREYTIVTNIDLYSYKVFEGKKYSYILINKELHKCSKKYENTIINMLEIYKRNFIKEIIIPQKELANFFSIVEPNIKDSLEIDNESYKEIKNYIPSELSAKVFLDYNDKNYIIAEVKFIYDDVEFNPLNQKNQPNNISRNTLKESKLLDILINSGFMLDQKNSKLVLADDDKIYNFLSKDIEAYMQYFEVLATDRFKSKEIKNSDSTSIGVRIENNLLDIDFSNIDFDINELQDIMKKYKLKKKYHRLKNGNYINLENNETINFINDITENIDIDYTNINKDSKMLELPIYRSLYLDKILEKINNLHVNKDESFKEIVDKLDVKEISNKEILPRKLNAKLRTYQVVGYKWLKTLDEYGLGGILADDMGLGKTIQAIALICDYKENNKKAKPSLVVCPSSLSLNWQAEIDKFSTGIKIQVMHGTLEERKKQIKEIPQYDVIITSYELLKRDIEEYEIYKYNFKYIFADEAQYIKNNNTQNAKAIKKINSETRFALTGTPIENSLSELWSIFDFIMPGYLFTYRKFKELYETPIVRDNDVRTMDKLKRLIEPFVLRRIKKEVLTELPDKMITVLNSQMVEKQQEIYLSFLAKAKKSAIEEIKENGVEKSQIKILALLTRLRQICCHPGLFINNYDGESGKLNQCMEIVKDAIQAGHKILLFSGYTSIFEYIQKELNKEGINYLKLTGQTKVSDRLSLVDEFNSNDNIKIFLISLKAGGTGINLTGADMVIHYDPWWNLSAENQATDRTYRIGQKRNVQVYKLITKNSIEEKIYDLQNRKEALIDGMLSTNQTFINKLSKEDIMSLFE